MNHFNNVESKLTGYLEVVENIEKKLVDLFEKKDCFLKIANLPNQKDKNVYFNSDTLYFYLKNAGDLVADVGYIPLTKNEYELELNKFMEYIK